MWLLFQIFLPYRHYLTKHLYLDRNSSAKLAILFVTNPTCILYLGNPNKSYQSQQNSKFGGKNIKGTYGDGVRYPARQVLLMPFKRCVK